MFYYKNARKYFSKYPDQNMFVSLLFGIGLGFLLTYPVAGTHPIRWGLFFLLMGTVGLLWAANQKIK